MYAPESVAAVAEIVAVVTVVSGLVFGIFQLRAHGIQQRNAVANNLAETFYNTEFARAALLLHQLPDGASHEEVQSKGPELEEAAVVICTSFETMGPLVYRRIAEFDIVMDLAGGLAASMSRKLQGWIKGKREVVNQPSWAEWFEWLATMSSKYKDKYRITKAEVAHWKPWEGGSKEPVINLKPCHRDQSLWLGPPALQSLIPVLPGSEPPALTLCAPKPGAAAEVGSFPAIAQTTLRQSTLAELPPNC